MSPDVEITPTPPIDEVVVLHRTRDYVIIRKPAGLHSVPGRGEDKQDSVETRLRQAIPEATGPLTVHRLDMETSGIMVFALHKDAHRAIQRQFMCRRTGKSYAALVEGRVKADEGAIDLPIIVDWPNRPRQHVDLERGRPARTLYRVMDRQDDHTRLSFRPITGRTHQLRVHASTPIAQGGLGCPILGDTLYGDPTNAPRLMLHADLLGFWDPGTSTWVKFDCPAPF